MTDEASAEHKQLAEEYRSLFESRQEEDEQSAERLDEIEARIEELEDTECTFAPETLAIAGAVVTIGHDGELHITRGLVRSEDVAAEPSGSSQPEAKEKPAFSASLIESLTACKSLAISATLMTQPQVALAAIVHALAKSVLRTFSNDSSLQLSVKLPHLREACKGKEALEEACDAWRERLPTEPGQLWSWCLAQDQGTLLELLAFCAAHAVDAVQRKADRPDCGRLAHASALETALNLDMAQWFTPAKENYFSRVSRTEILSAISEAKGTPAKRSWEKLKKSELAALAEREIAGTGWLPKPLRA
jgi:ParB family chromosome partitioning protein